MSDHQSKSLLIGASGQIGSHILNIIGSTRCLATSRKQAGGAELQLDLASLSSKNDVEHLLGARALDAIYCIAGMTNVEGCESAPEQAHLTNCRGPEILARIANERGIPFVYFSTEYVFDGESGPYVEDSPPNPLNVYGKSKLAGERAVIASCSHALVVRTTVVYGQDRGHKNYLYSLMKSLVAGKEMRVPADQVSTPTYNRDLAIATVKMVQSSASGIYHACGPERMSRFEFANGVADYLGLDASHLTGVITDCLGQKASRPLSAGLSIDKLRQAHPEIRMRSLREGLSDCVEQLREFLTPEIRVNARP